ncbi:MAG: HAD-IIB family hydrolase [Candidatus Marsarchaeota archaeon]|nr:HAD-IIB family hydrolase [Candidatus Marsarchaeota archaeon]MCL5106237.1 HAD-IIB family hydrolase [Candidatus Marsarchaeota archaeon]
MKIDYNTKKIIVADLDGTLAPSRSRMDSDMSELIMKLLDYKQFAVISGGAYSQFKKEFISGLKIGKKHKNIKKLYLMPTCATSFYRFKSGKWKKIYEERLQPPERRRIFSAFKTALKKIGYSEPLKKYGKILDDRGTQVTFSGMGQRAPLKLKSKWDPDLKKRKRIKRELELLIPEFEIRIGGTTSIDITRKGIDKAYGIRRLGKCLKFSLKEMLFIGDALFKDGNDYPVKRAGVDCIAVSGPQDTKKVLRKIINSSI